MGNGRREKRNINHDPPGAGQIKQQKQAPVPASTMPPPRREESLRPDGKPCRKEGNTELSVRKQDKQVPGTAQSMHVGNGRREKRKINHDPLGAEAVEQIMKINVHHSQREEQQRPQQDYLDTIPVWSERWLKLKESKQKTMHALSKDALEPSIAEAQKQLGEELERMRRKEREPKYQDLWARMQAIKQSKHIADELDYPSNFSQLFPRGPTYKAASSTVIASDLYKLELSDEDIDVLFRKELNISGHTCVYPYCVGNKCCLESKNISDPLGVEAGSQDIRETFGLDSEMQERVNISDPLGIEADWQDIQETLGLDSEMQQEQQQQGSLERYPVWSNIRME